MTHIVEIDIGGCSVWVFEDHGVIYNREALTFLRGPQGYAPYVQAMTAIAQLERKP